jgi:hypothetical protein
MIENEQQNEQTTPDAEPVIQPAEHENNGCETYEIGVQANEQRDESPTSDATCDNTQDAPNEPPEPQEAPTEQSDGGLKPVCGWCNTELVDDECPECDDDDCMNGDCDCCDDDEDDEINHGILFDKHSFIATALATVDNIKVVKYRGKLFVKELCHKAFFARIFGWLKGLFVSEKPKVVKDDD